MKSDPPTPTNDTPQTVLTVDELAQRLRVSIRTVRQWVADGRIPCLRIGQTVRFDWDEVRNHAQNP